MHLPAHYSGCCDVLQCPAPAKLPALYVVDSIVKNVKEPYLSLFGNRLAEVSFKSSQRVPLLDWLVCAHAERLREG